MPKQTSNNDNVVYIVAGSRTPFIKAQGKPGPFAASDLAQQTCRQLLARQPFAASDLNEVIVGCVAPSADEVNIARIIALRIGCGNSVPAWTVQRNCASGLQALDCAFQDIQSGRHHLVLAGGTEAMSRTPLLYNHYMVNWLAQLSAAKGVWQKAAVASKIRPKFFVPVIALLKGLTDPIVNLNMGQTAENLAYRFNINRLQMDEYAVQSHQRLANAIDQQWLSEITPIIDHHGNVYETDEGLRRDSSVEKLAKLKPVFDRRFGSVTAGNSSQITDGAAFLILASEAAVQRYHLTPLAKITATQWAALDPAQMGLGPVYAITQLLQKNNLSKNDIDYWEINEAFAAQVLGCLQAWQDETFCREQLGLSNAFGAIDSHRLNTDGGAIAVGHPVGASGARLVLHLLHTLERNHAKHGIASLCIGGGQGGAMLIERL